MFVHLGTIHKGDIMIRFIGYTLMALFLIKFGPLFLLALWSF